MTQNDAVHGDPLRDFLAALVITVDTIISMIIRCKLLNRGRPVLLTVD